MKTPVQIASSLVHTAQKFIDKRAAVQDGKLNFSKLEKLAKNPDRIGKTFLWKKDGTGKDVLATKGFSLGAGLANYVNRKSTRLDETKKFIHEMERVARANGENTDQDVQTAVSYILKGGWAGEGYEISESFGQVAGYLAVAQRSGKLIEP